jgi:hypothetical protein
MVPIMGMELGAGGPGQGRNQKVIRYLYSGEGSKIYKLHSLLNKYIGILIQISQMKRDFKKPVFIAATGLIVVSLMLLTYCKEEAADQLPVLNTIQAADADVTSSTADLKGEITILGNQKIVEYGIQISPSLIFSTYTDKKTSAVAAVGEFTVNFTGLNPNTIYYYRAYAIVNTAHIYAPDPLHFTTKN